MIDLAKSLDLPAVPADKYNDSLTIVTEFNSSVQGFLVEDVDRIVHLRWEDILPPPDSLQNVNYLTGITRAQDQIVEIVDVEKYWLKYRACKSRCRMSFYITINPKQKAMTSLFWLRTIPLWRVTN